MVYKRVSATIVALMLLMTLASGVFSLDYTNLEIIEISNDCLDCHDDKAESIAGSAHQNTPANSAVPLKTGCIGCHDGWEEHLEEPSVDNIGRPQNYSLSRQSEVCSGCHQSSHQTSMITSDPHGQAGVTCLSCHLIHDNTNENLLTANKQEFCLSCHNAIANEFNQRSAHPYESENIFCTDCHKMDETVKGMLTGGLDRICQNCHPEYAGPYLHEHPVTSAFYIDGGGCVECHQPHGSHNDRLLNQPGQGVCLQCHGMPPAHLTAHSGLGSRSSCVDCHTQIHGSYDNSKFLDLNLGAVLGGDCYQSGCHSIGE